MRTLIITLAILLSLSSGTHAQIFGELGANRVATTSFDFLKIGIGAREIAMGESGITSVEDANALFWNPAHITYLPDVAATFNYNMWYADLSQMAMATSFRFNTDFTFGLSINYISTEPMLRRTTLQPLGTGEKFNFYDLAVGATLARQMTDQFSFGVTLKVIQEKLAEVDFQAYVMDLGMTYLLDGQNTRLSIALVNFGGRQKPTGEATPPDVPKRDNFDDFATPANFRLGFSYMPYEDDFHSLLTTSQLNHPNDGAENYSIGAEYGYLKTFFIRSGYKFNVDGQTIPSFGFGLKKMIMDFDMQIDYAASQIDRLGFAHRLTLGLSLPDGVFR